MAAIERDVTRRQGTGRPVVEVATEWAGMVLDVRQLEAKGRFTVGEDPSCDCWVPADAIGGASRAVLVEVGAEGPVVLPPRSAALRLHREGRPAQQVEAAGSAPLEGGVTAEVEVGSMRFRVRTTDAGEIDRGGLVLDRTAIAWGGISLFAHATFLALIYLSPPDPGSISLDAVVEGNRFVSYLVAPPELEPPATPEILAPAEERTEREVAGDAHEGVEGQAGREDAPAVNRRFGIKNRGLDRVMLAREDARRLAETGGILAVIRSEAPVSPFGSAIPNGVDAEDALGHLLGREVGSAFGYGGLGVRGTGRGGGGIDGGSGLGRLRTIGDRVGGGTGGTCYGCGPSSLGRGHRASGPTVSMGTATASGALSPEVIRRHIRQHTNAVRHCYEAELARRPDLSGRVAIRFVIGQDGTVVSAAVAESSVESPSVGQCVAGAIRRIGFPPPGVGVVVVTYPFTFVHD